VTGPKGSPASCPAPGVAATGTGRFADVAAGVLAAPAKLGPVRLVAVDGPAGSGKTTFARRLADALRRGGATVAQVHTDDLLDGWSDMVGFWARLDTGVLAPLRRGEPGEYLPYDWAAGRFGTRPRTVAVPDVLVLEGVTSGRAAIRAELSLLVWVEAPAALRLSRGVDRDGEAMRADWLRWMAGEAGHFADDRPQIHADLRIDGAPRVRHDPETEFVGVISGWTWLTR
jgi:hypothetical protein